MAKTEKESGTAAEKTEEKKLPVKKMDKKMEATVKEVEGAIYKIRFYPVAVSEDEKNDAIKKLEKIYNKGNETVRQLLLYLIHNQLAKATDIKTMHTYEYFKAKSPDQDPAQIRMSVYRAMFNYNTSLEGLAELFMLLGRLNGGDEAAKLLTYYYSRFCAVENEGMRMLRAAIIDALAKSESHYALKALLNYARYSDNEMTVGRLVNALIEWEEKLDGLDISAKEKKKLSETMKEFITKEGRASHYG